MSTFNSSFISNLDDDNILINDLIQLSINNSNYLQDLYNDSNINIHNIINEYSNILFDENRKNFILKNIKILNDLEKGILDQENRYRQLLLGIKLSGKTIILNILNEYIKRKKNSKILTIFQNCKNIELTPLQNIKHILLNNNLIINYESNIPNNMINQLEKFLIKKKKFLFIIYDDFQYIYTKEKFGIRFISEICCLAGSNKGRIHMIVSGNSSILRKLAVCELSNEEKIKYSSYTSVELNSTKLQPYWIYNFTTEKSFIELIERYNSKIESKIKAQIENQLDEFLVDFEKSYEKLLNTDQIKNKFSIYEIENFSIQNILKNKKKLVDIIFLKNSKLNNENYTNEISNLTCFIEKYICQLYFKLNFDDTITDRVIPKELYAASFLCSGGRPGLIKYTDINNIPYPLTLKTYGSDNSIESIILKSLTDWSSNTTDNIDLNYSSELKNLCDILCPIPAFTLEQKVKEKIEKTQIFNYEEYERALYNLQDEGYIVSKSCSTTNNYCLSGPYLYFQLKYLNQKSLSWRELAALKMPEGIFHIIAEDTALKIIRKNWRNLFPEFTIDEIAGGIFDLLPISNSLEQVYTLDSNLNSFANMLHKELNNNKDHNEADFILFHATPNMIENNEVDLIRVQLKLGGSKHNKKIKFTDFQSIRKKMITRGNKFYNALINKGFSVKLYYNILLTTKFCETEKDIKNNRILEYNEEYESIKSIFIVKDCTESYVLWPDEVLSLGIPYSLNFKTNIDSVE